jgi:hypothetical protein
MTSTASGRSRNRERTASAVRSLLHATVKLFLSFTVDAGRVFVPTGTVARS